MQDSAISRLIGNRCACQDWVQKEHQPNFPNEDSMWLSPLCAKHGQRMICQLKENKIPQYKSPENSTSSVHNKIILRLETAVGYV